MCFRVLVLVWCVEGVCKGGRERRADLALLTLVVFEPISSLGERERKERKGKERKGKERKRKRRKRKE